MWSKWYALWGMAGFWPPPCWLWLWLLEAFPLKPISSSSIGADWERDMLLCSMEPWRSGRSRLACCSMDEL